MSDDKRSGGCLCGAVKYEVALAEPEVHACHCGMCQKWSGGPALALSCEGELSVSGEENLTWYDSSEWAQRGFCSKCGTHLFGRAPEAGYLGVYAGSLDDKSGLHLGLHIFIDKKPGYYAFAGDAKTLTEEQFLAQFAEGES